MKTLLILRHAKSSWKDASLADHDRPLKKRGMRDAIQVGNLLRERDLVPQLILGSTAKRVRQTVDLALDACHYEGEIVFKSILYASDPEIYVSVLRTLDDVCQRVMVVGHNPDLEALLEMLTGEFEVLRTAALAEVALPLERWGDLDEGVDGKLRNLWVPQQTLTAS